MQKLIASLLFFIVHCSLSVLSVYLGDGKDEVEKAPTHEIRPRINVFRVIHVDPENILSL